MPKNALCRKEFTNTELNINVRTLENEDGSISISAEDTAIGFGWTQTQTKNGKKYTSIRWETLNSYCSEIGFPNILGKDDYIPESLFYMLGMKANNKTAQEFQRWLAMDVIPSIRKTGTYSTGQKPMCIEDAIIESMKLQKELKEQLNQVNCHALEAKAQSQEVKQEIEDMKDGMPLFKVECDDLVSMVKKKATHILGGYKSNAYNDKSILQRVYKDIYAQINREFGVEKCSGIKRKDFDIAKQFVEDYKAPMVLVQDINLANSQTTLFDKKEEQGA